MFAEALPKLRLHSHHVHWDGLKDCLTRVSSWAGERYCAVRGHDHLVQFASGRIFLRCACGHETPGWQIDPPRYRVLRSTAATRPQAVARLRPAA